MLTRKPAYLTAILTTQPSDFAETSQPPLTALMMLQNELLKKAHNRDAYDEAADEIFQFRELKSKSESGKIQRNEKLSRITDLRDFIKSRPAGITEFDESLSRRLIKKNHRL